MPVARLIKITAIEVLGLLGRRLITISFVVTAVGCVSVPKRHPLPPDFIKYPWKKASPGFILEP